MALRAGVTQSTTEIERDFPWENCDHQREKVGANGTHLEQFKLIASVGVQGLKKKRDGLGCELLGIGEDFRPLTVT